MFPARFGMFSSHLGCTAQGPVWRDEAAGLDGKDKQLKTVKDGATPLSHPPSKTAKGAPILLPPLQPPREVKR